MNFVNNFKRRGMHYWIGVLLLICGTEARTCERSYDCPRRAMCCRNSNGDTLPLQEGVHVIDPFISPQTTGRCSSRLAREHEQCHPTDCKCAPGFDCYLPVSGVCCFPYRCYNATWVKQQREFWEKCFRDPSCPLPP